VALRFDLIQYLLNDIWVSNIDDKAHGANTQWAQRTANRSDRYLSDKIGGIGGDMQHATTAKMVSTW
jgi:hypothetical protein